MSQSIRFFGSSVLSIAVLITGLIGCGGSNGSGVEGALGACTPSEGPRGSTVVCEAGELSEDCTVFFGNTPVEFTLSEDGTVSFTVPTVLAGEKSIHAQCGDGVVTPLGKFNVKARDLSDDSDVPPSEVAPSDGDEVIQPSGGEGPSEVPPPAETPEEPAAPPSASIASFAVTKVETGKLNTVKISWNFSNAKTAYVWGDFNREADDTHCGLIGGRHLVTNPTGQPLNEGSDLYEKNLPFLEGTLCDNAGADASKHCKSPASTAALSLSKDRRRPLYASRFDHGSATGDLYFYDQVKTEHLGQFKLEQEEGSALKHLSSEMALFMEEPNPNCRIDLNRDDASLISSGDVHTRSLVQHGRFCLAVQGSDDTWTVQCKSIEAPKAGITSRWIQAEEGQRALKLTLNYVNGVGAEVTGCAQIAHSVQPDGTGHYEGRCAVNATAKAMKAVVRGLGKSNFEKRDFSVELGKPDVSLEFNGSPPLKNEERDFNLTHTAVRDLTVKEEGTVVLETEVSWFHQVYFEGFSSGNGWASIGSPSQVNGTKTVHQDVHHNLWRFGVRDFDGGETVVDRKTDGFPKSFDLDVLSGTGGMTLSNGDTCDDAKVVIRHGFTWSGENVQSFTVTGLDGQTVWEGSQSILPHNQYGLDTGTLFVYRDLGQKDDTWTADMKFRVDVTFQDGGTESHIQSMTGWSCN